MFWRPAIFGPRLFLRRGQHTGKSLASSILAPANAPFITPDSGLSPVLLTRARLLAAEHAKLSDRLAEAFDTKIAKRAGELASVSAVLKEWDDANEVWSELPQ